MTDMTTANTILQQLGGSRFLAMTGAKNLLGGDNYLRMRLPQTLTRQRINVLSITIDRTSDTYTVEAFRARGINATSVAKSEGVFCDNLRTVFTAITGLDTRL